MKRDAQIIWHIRDYCLIITDYVARCGSYRAFSEDRLYLDGISMNLQQIGELVGQLSDTFKSESSNRVMWGFIKAMRNRFAHEYKKMDKDIIWDTASNDIAALLAFCNETIEQNPEAFIFPDKPEGDE